MAGVGGQACAAVPGFVPGIPGAGFLLVVGLSLEECYLPYRPISGKGLAVLVAVFVFALAAVRPASHWTGWHWSAALLYAPASGISQELFFRAALLPALMELSSETGPEWRCSCILLSLIVAHSSSVGGSPVVGRAGGCGCAAPTWDRPGMEGAEGSDAYLGHDPAQFDLGRRVDVHADRLSCATGSAEHSARMTEKRLEETPDQPGKTVTT